MQPTLSDQASLLEFFPHDYFAPVSIGEIFPERPDAPLQIDLGCGDGTFLNAMAARHPEANFLGVERLLGRVRRCCRKAVRAGNTNVRLFRIESHYLLQYLLPAGCVDVIHIMFPDPWPKRRHESKRLIQAPFLDVAHRTLKPGGEIRLTTDNLPYYTQMREVFFVHPGFREEPWDPGPDYPQTDFERHFRSQGLPIYRALLRKRE